MTSYEVLFGASTLQSTGVMLACLALAICLVVLAIVVSEARMQRWLDLWSEHETGAGSSPVVRPARERTRSAVRIDPARCGIRPCH